MRGLDTNVLVRYIMQDDARQSNLASNLIESLTVEAPGFVPQVAFVELIWVLSSCYDLERAQMVAAMEARFGPRKWSWKGPRWSGGRFGFTGTVSLILRTA